MAGRTVILIDDDPDDFAIFKMALESSSPDLTCIYFESATAALDELKRGVSTAEFIFLDLNMPGMNGMQFLEAIKRMPAAAGIPVIVYSTSIIPSSRQRLLDLGAHYFFIKPFSHQELVRTLGEILNNEGGPLRMGQ